MRRVVLLAFIWGWSFLFIKVAVAGMSPAAVAWARVAFGLVVMMGVLRARGASLPRDRTLWRHFAVMGLVYSAVPFTLIAWSEEHITSALASVLNASTPMFAAIAAAVALGERLRRVHIAGLALGFVGVAVAAGVAGGDLAGSSVLGLAGMIGASACYGFGFTYARRHLDGVPPLVASCGQLVTAAVLSTPAALVTSVGRELDLAPHRVLAIVLLGVFGTGFAYVLNYQAIADIGPTRASLVTYLVPLVAVTVGVLFLDEPFHLRLLVGGGLTVVGISLLQERLRMFKRVPVTGPVALLPVLVAVGVFGLGLGACGSEDTGGALGSGDASRAGRCGAIVAEPLDPRSTQHILPGAPEPTYASDPPTSGPHRVGGPLRTGVLASPLTPSEQVTVLEHGGVLVHHRGLSGDDRRRVERQAGGDVRVMENPSLPAPVVLTAWRHRMVCEGLDVEAIKAFVRAHAGKSKGD